MMYPFLNMKKGAIWYQGEANSLYNSEIYSCIFQEMINDWRKKWFEGTGGSTDQMFPFGFVQVILEISRILMEINFANQQD